MRRVKRVMACTIMIIISVLLVACDNKKTSPDDKIKTSTESLTDDSGRIVQEIAENVSINAELPEVMPETALIYEVSGREFDLKQAVEMLEVDLGNATYIHNPDNGSDYYDFDENGYVSVSKGSFGYRKTSKIVDIQNIYFNKLTSACAKSDETLSDEDVIYATGVLKEIYHLQDNENLVLTKAVKVSPDTVKQTQKEQMDAGESFGNGKMDHEVVTDDVLENCRYLLSFSVYTDGIKEMENDGYGYILADCEKGISVAQINMAVGNHQIIFMEFYGVYHKENSEEKELISLQEALEILGEKYERQIVTAPQTFNEVSLEYIFVKDVKSEEYNVGTLVPYWKFVNRSSLYAERINAVTGDDFEYE